MQIAQTNVEWSINWIDIGKEMAVELYESKFCEDWPPEDIVLFQFNSARLCMEFPIFNKAVAQVIGRPVYTHEMVDPELKRDALLIANWIRDKKVV